LHEGDLDAATASYSKSVALNPENEHGKAKLRELVRAQ
jgi:hypothetical protein